VSAAEVLEPEAAAAPPPAEPLTAAVEGPPAPPSASPPANVLILDTETTGKEPGKDHAVEVGVILYSLDYHAPIASYASLLRVDPHGREAAAINGIPPELIPMAPPADVVWSVVRAFASSSCAILAHKATFDRSMVPEDLRRMKRWVCTCDDIEWPSGIESRSLVQIALSLGVGVSAAHRALTDCDLIARSLQRCAERGHDVKEMLRRGFRPKGLYVSLASFDEKETVKAHRFKWNDLVPKKWARRMAIEDVPMLPFAVERVA
jgi:DNA polymerase-3 subunit epsilon